jgi:hypothetical protein
MKLQWRTNRTCQHAIAFVICMECYVESHRRRTRVPSIALNQCSLRMCGSLITTASNIIATFARVRALVLNHATGKMKVIWESHWLRNIYDRTRRHFSDMSRSLTMPRASYDAAWPPTWQLLFLSMIGIAMRILIFKVSQWWSRPMAIARCDLPSDTKRGGGPIPDDQSTSTYAIECSLSRCPI